MFGLETMRTFFALSTIVANIMTVGIVVLAIVYRRSATNPFASLRGSTLWLAGGVAAFATVGSLYLSESAGLIPCTLCWYQRIAMYPLVLILGIAMFRRDIAVRIYAIPLALVGAAIASYHYLLEWFPEIDTGACSAVIPCTQVWFREFGFVSMPLLALIAFGLVIAFLLVPLRSSDEEDGEDEEAHVQDDGDEEVEAG